MNPFKCVSGGRSKRKAKGRRCECKSKCAKVDVKQEPGIKEEPNNEDNVIDVLRPGIDDQYHVNYEGTIDFNDDFDGMKNEIKSEEEEEEADEKKESAACAQLNENDDEESMVNTIGMQPKKSVGSLKKQNGSFGIKRMILRNQAAKKQKKHKCHLCNHLASNKYNLKVHLRTHTGERPFKCDVCSKSFAQKVNLNHHQKTHGEFRCPKCNQGFEQESAKIDHERLCNPRQFECDICGYRTIYKSALILHMRIHGWIADL